MVMMMIMIQFTRKLIRVDESLQFSRACQIALKFLYAWLEYGFANATE